jgi:hypothetical protein
VRLSQWKELRGKALPPGQNPTDLWAFSSS